MGNGKKENGTEKLVKIMQKFRQSERNNLIYWNSNSEKDSSGSKEPKGEETKEE